MALLGAATSACGQQLQWRAPHRPQFKQETRTRWTPAEPDAQGRASALGDRHAVRAAANQPQGQARLSQPAGYDLGQTSRAQHAAPRERSVITRRDVSRHISPPGPALDPFEDSVADLAERAAPGIATGSAPQEIPYDPFAEDEAPSEPAPLHEDPSQPYSPVRPLDPPPSQPPGPASNTRPQPRTRAQPTTTPLTTPMTTPITTARPTVMARQRDPEAYTTAAANSCAQAIETFRNRTLSSIDLDVRLAGRAGDDYPADCLLDDQPYLPRSWAGITYMWKASALCHKPLYFENSSLERYGHSSGPYVQPVVSGAHFFSSILVLPYKMGLTTPQECVYTLGHYRPGSCAPYLLPAVPFTWRAGLFQAGAVVGVAALVP